MYIIYAERGRERERESHRCCYTIITASYIYIDPYMIHHSWYVTLCMFRFAWKEKMIYWSMHPHPVVLLWDERRAGNRWVDAIITGTRHFSGTFSMMDDEYLTDAFMLMHCRTSLFICPWIPGCRYLSTIYFTSSLFVMSLVAFRWWIPVLHPSQCDTNYFVWSNLCEIILDGNNLLDVNNSSSYFTRSITYTMTN